MSRLIAAVSMRQLVYFIAVAEANSFRAAAEALHMSQPPLTQQIQALERVLGVELFDRSKRRIELTAAGLELLDDARNIIAAANRSFERARAVGRGLFGNIRVGLADDFIFGPTFARVLQFSRDNPQISIETYVGTSSDLVVKLEQNAFDLILTNLPLAPHDGALVQHALPPSRVLALVPQGHRLAGHINLTPKDLADEVLICMPLTTSLPFTRVIARLFGDAGVSLRAGHQTVDTSIAIRLASEGMGIAVVSEFSVSKDLPGLVAIPFAGDHCLEHTLVHHDRRLPPALERLVAAVLAP
jgi:DNA-binding transcriptional LysR family regulator